MHRGAPCTRGYGYTRAHTLSSVTYEKHPPLREISSTPSLASSHFVSGSFIAVKTERGSCNRFVYALTGKTATTIVIIVLFSGLPSHN